MEHVAKWAHRHRAVLIVAASVALVALGIGGELVWQERQRTVTAKHVFAESFQLLTLADGLTYSGMGKWAMSRTAEEQPEKQRFNRQALEFYDRLANTPSLDPRLQALALHRLAFTRMYTGSGMPAEDHYRRSIALYEGLLAANPGDDELRAALADTYNHLGFLLMFPPGGLSKAESSLRSSIKIQEERAIESRHPDVLAQAAEERLQLAKYLEESRKPAESERERRAVLDLFERLTAPVNAGDQTAFWAATIYEKLAGVMARHQYDREQETALRRGLAFVPDHAGLVSSLASLLAFRTDADPKLQAEAVALAKKAVDVVPEYTEFRRVLALAHLHAHDLNAATEAVEQALKQQDGKGQVSDWLLMAMIRYDQGRRDKARRWYDRAVKDMAHNVNDTEAAQKLAEPFRYLLEADRRMKPLLAEAHIAGDPGRPREYGRRPSNGSSDMHRLAEPLAGGLHDGLGIGRVRVHGVEDLLLGGLELLGHHQLGDQLGRLRADQVGAQELAVLGVEDQLDEPLGLVGGQGPAAELERELADADLVAGLARGLLRQPDAGDARVGVGAAGDRRVVHRAVGEPAEPLDAADRLVVRDVRQPGRADHVADRVDPRHARDIPVLRVGLDVVLEDLHLHVVGEEALDVAQHADGHQHLLGLDHRLPLGRLDLGLDPLVGLLDLGRLRAGVDRQAPLGQALVQARPRPPRPRRGGCGRASRPR